MPTIFSLIYLSVTWISVCLTAGIYPTYIHIIDMWANMCGMEVLFILAMSSIDHAAQVEIEDVENRKYNPISIALKLNTVRQKELVSYIIDCKK